MSRDVIIVGSAALFVLLILLALLAAKVIKRRKFPDKVKQQWLEIQRLCTNKETWVSAVIGADQLLHRVLKKLRFKGKSTGELMVSAQRRFSDNDTVWYAHKLAKKLTAQKNPAIREAKAKKSLVGIRQALRDLGMLNEK